MAENSKTVIQCKNLNKTYRLFKRDNERLRSMFTDDSHLRKRQAIHDISFEIQQGESVALFGRNGAGKSTLLKIITGVTYPTHGTLRVDGRVSALLQLSAGFNPEMTGRENIYFRGEILGLRRSEIKAIEQDIIDFSELGEYIDMPIRTYSSGMTARLGFALNVNVKPDILIVDEALSVGDVNFQRKCLKKIKEILASKTTFLYVTHSTASAREFCKRGMVLQNGKLIYDGDIDSAALFYRDSLGMSRILPGVNKKNGGS